MKLSRNVVLGARMVLSPWRNLSLGAWRSPSEASVCALVELDADPVLRFMEDERGRSGVRVTMVHCVGKCLGLLLREFPDVNCVRRLGGLYSRRDVDLFFNVAMDGRGDDLSGIVLRGVDRMPVVALAEALTKEAYRLRKHGDEGFERMKRQGVVAAALSRLWMRAGGFFLYTLNVWHPAMGMPRDAFGSAVVTDVSRFGAEYVFPPLLPIARVPLVMAVGPVRKTPGGRDSGPGRRLRLSVVFDHRVIDGVYAGRMLRRFRQVFAEPERHLRQGPPVPDREQDPEHAEHDRR